MQNYIFAFWRLILLACVFLSHQSVSLSLYLCFLAVVRLQVSCVSRAQTLCQPPVLLGRSGIVLSGPLCMTLVQGKQLVDPPVPLPAWHQRLGTSHGVKWLRPTSHFWYKPCTTALSIHLEIDRLFQHCQVCKVVLCCAGQESWCSKQESSLSILSVWVQLIFTYTVYFLCMCSLSFGWSPFLVSRAALSTGSDSVLTAAALPVSWFSPTPLRMFTSSSSPVSLSHPPLRPLPWSHVFFYVGALSSRPDSACLGLVWPRHRQWRWLLSWGSWSCWNPDDFSLCTLNKQYNILLHWRVL